MLPLPLRPWSRQIEPVLRMLLVPQEVVCGLDRARFAGTGARFAQGLLDGLDIRFSVDDADLERLPAAGALVVVANHPYGIAEGLILSVLLDRIRPDWKILGNSMLAGVREFDGHILPVNPFGTPEASVQNRVPLRRSIEWLGSGGALAVFPAGEVAHLDLKRHAVTDPDWQSTAARLALRARCAVVPIFFEGANSLSFQLAGVLHPGLRTAGLVRELARLSGRMVRVRVGTPIPYAALAARGGAGNATFYMRCRTLLLAHCGTAPAVPAARRRPAPLAAPQPERILAAEVAALPAEAELARQGDLSAWVADAHQIPHILLEIGRCREETFRAAGEGTGRAADLDRFDPHYRHLFLWDRGARALAGAYRLAVTTEVLARFGPAGLYTATLFRFKQGFFDRLGPAVELGRSFVCSAYQKDFAPLLLLWKGISRLVARRPEAPLLFGAVSISREYRPASRGLIAAYLSSRLLHPLSPYVCPRRRFAGQAARDPHILHLAAQSASLDELSAAIADLERDGKGVPVLVRQYLRNGGRLLGLSVDPGFSDTLDALILTDLRQAPPALLERCMGRDEARAFLAKCGAGAFACQQPA
jgi:putative hemolysin